MKKNTGNNIKLGAFVSVGIVLLIAAIYMIGSRQHLFSTTFRLSAVFTDIAGLQVGGNVRFSGINVGVIESIEQVTDTTVQVDMQIAERSRKFIKENAVAIVASDGLVGDKIISIKAGKPGMSEVASDDFIATLQPVGFDDVMVDLKRTSENAVIITEDLAFILENLAAGNGAIGKLLFDSAFSEQMEGALVNLKEGAGGFKDNMDAAKHSVLLKGYLKKKEKMKAKAAEEKAAAAQEAKEAKETPEADTKPARVKRNVIGKD